MASLHMTAAECNLVPGKEKANPFRRQLSKRVGLAKTMSLEGAKRSDGSHRTTWLMGFVVYCWGKNGSCFRLPLCRG